MKLLDITKPYKVIISTNVDLEDITIHLAFVTEHYDTAGGYVFIYNTEKSAQLDMNYLMRYVKEIKEEDIEIVQFSFNELF